MITPPSHSTWPRHIALTLLYTVTMWLVIVVARSYYDIAFNAWVLPLIYGISVLVFARPHRGERHAARE